MLNQTVQRVGTLCALSICLSVNPIAYANDMGMTWKKVSHNDQLGIDRVYCINCDAYQGDTSCETKLPILCLKKDNSPDPGIPIPTSATTGVMPHDFYHGWGEGHIGLTFPVRGDDLAGVADANDICEVQFGPGYRMGEHHDGKVQSGGYGGWGWYAYGNVDDSSRFWANINGQSANCWGNSPGGHIGRTEAEILALLLGSDNPSPSVCTEAELDAAYQNGVDSCGTSNYPSPTYRFDSGNNTGVLTLPTVDIEMINPLIPNTWLTLYDAYSVVMELMPTSGYFYLTEVTANQPATDTDDATSTQPATQVTEAKNKQEAKEKQPATDAASTQQVARVK
jgi:hypothetical protein